MLARAATGSFRDALGTLEQLVTYGGKEVRLDEVLDILGVADAELVLDAAEALADHDPKAALLTVKRLSDSGRDFTQFMRDVSAHLRHLFVVQTLGEVPDSFSVTAEHTDRLAAQAKRLPQGELLRAIDFLAAAIAAVKDGSEPRIQLEMALLKATQPSADLSLQALMHRIERLESGLAAARPAASPRRQRRPSRSRSPSSPRAAVTRRAPPGAAARGERAGGGGRGRGREEATEPVDRRGARPGARALAGRGRGRGRGERHARRGAGAARPVALEGERLTVAFPADAAFVKKKAEANRELVQQARARPHRQRSDGRVRASRRRSRTPSRLLSTRMS